MIKNLVDPKFISAAWPKKAVILQLETIDPEMEAQTSSHSVVAKYDEDSDLYWIRDPNSADIWAWESSEKLLLWATPIISMKVLIPQITMASTSPNTRHK